MDYTHYPNYVVYVYMGGGGIYIGYLGLWGRLCHGGDGITGLRSDLTLPILLNTEWYMFYYTQILAQSTIRTLPYGRYTRTESLPVSFCIITRIGVFACGQILCISPNGLQASHGIN